MVPAMWIRCDLQVWSIDDTLYATPLDEGADKRMQREWARHVGAELLPLTLRAGAPITEVAGVQGSLARCTVDDMQVLMNVAWVEPEPN
jgi:hypothetical protein